MEDVTSQTSDAGAALQDEKRTHKCTKQSMKKGGYMKREEESVDLIAESREQVQEDRRTTQSPLGVIHVLGDLR